MYAIQLTGAIKVMDVIENKVIPPPVFVLEPRFDTHEEAEKRLDLIKKAFPSTAGSREIIEIPNPYPIMEVLT